MTRKSAQNKLKKLQQSGSLAERDGLAARPGRILRHYVQRRCRKESIGVDQAAERFARESDVEPRHIHDIIEGRRLPTSHEIERITRTMNWSIFFLFGISEKAYQQAENAFYEESGCESPTSVEREAFKGIYTELLLQFGDEDSRPQGGGRSDNQDGNPTDQDGRAPERGGKQSDDAEVVATLLACRILESTETTADQWACLKSIAASSEAAWLWTCLLAHCVSEESRPFAARICVKLLKEKPFNLDITYQTWLDDMEMHIDSIDFLRPGASIEWLRRACTMRGANPEQVHETLESLQPMQFAPLLALAIMGTITREELVELENESLTAAWLDPFVALANLDLWRYSWDAHPLATAEDTVRIWETQGQDELRSKLFNAQ